MAYIYNPYPRMLYRVGEERVVADAREEATAKDEGWRNTSVGDADPLPSPVEIQVGSDALAVEIEPDAPIPAVRRPVGRPRKDA